MIYTFWEGRMPDYIKLCLKTWKFPHEVLSYDNLRQYTDYDFRKAKRFTLPQQADCVRAHVLRDNGGRWLDADTIVVTGKLPDETILGNDQKRINTIGYLNAENGREFFERWSEYQDRIIENSYGDSWDIVGNRFTDAYLWKHNEIKIGDIRNRWPETYMVQNELSRYKKYDKFYFESSYHLSDIDKTDMLMLHNSWTPGWYKELTREQVLFRDCTLSNILREVV